MNESPADSPLAEKSAAETSPGSKLEAEHAAAVSAVQAAVREFSAAGKAFRVYHGSTSSTRPVQFSRSAIVDVSGMTRLFPVDRAGKTVRVEPNVPMDALAAHALAAGLVPKIVMEFKGITAGGGYSGMSGESAMFKYGLFQQTVSAAEFVLGDGSVVTATRAQHADLLEHAGGSLGSLGVVTLLTVELVDAHPFVDVHISRIPDAPGVPAAMEAAIARDPHFVDGIFFGRDRLVMMVGNMVAAPATPPLSTRQVHWFARDVAQRARRRPDALPATVSLHIADYLFRYDHGAFWGGELAFRHFHLPNNALTRRLADPFLDSRTCYAALHRTGLANEYVVQDFGIPASTVADFVDHVARVLPDCQLFLCPAKSPDGMGLRNRYNPGVFGHVADQRVYGVGVYGRGPADHAKFVELNRDLERYAREKCLGAKLLYARTYYTEEEFWEMFDRDTYDDVRRKYHAEKLPSVFDKLKADMQHLPRRRPIRGIAETVIKKWMGHGDYLLKA